MSGPHLCFKHAPQQWGACFRVDGMEQVWRDGKGGWGCLHCRTIIGPLDIEDDTQPSTAGEWRSGQAMLIKARNL